MIFIPKQYQLDGDGISSDCTPTASENHKAAMTDWTSISVTVNNDPGFQKIISWTTLAGEPEVADWPRGEYKGSINVTAVPAGGIFLGRLLIRTVNSSCTVISTQTDSGTFTSTGVHTYGLTIDPPAGSVGDRLQLVVEVYRPSGGAGTLTIAPGSDSYVKGPLQPTHLGVVAEIVRRQSDPRYRN